MSKNVRDYVFILQGEMSSFQRAVIARYLYKKATQLGLGIACNYGHHWGELTYHEMMDAENHPEELYE